MSYDCGRAVRNFGMRFFTNWYQEHCKSDVWPKFHCPTLLPKRKATSEKLRFFWGRVYIKSSAIFKEELRFWQILRRARLAGPWQCIQHVQVSYWDIYYSRHPFGTTKMFSQCCFKGDILWGEGEGGVGGRKVTVWDISSENDNCGLPLISVSPRSILYLLLR